jgi:hypothetical protein
MGFISGLWLALLGVLGAASLIIARRPDAKTFIDKLVPYQGWIGAFSAIWGVLTTLQALLAIRVLTLAPISWLSWFVAGLLLVGLGLLLGVGILKSFITGARAQQKMDEAIVRLAPYQGKLGVVAIVLGLWLAVSALFYRLA